jgi:hypothetical protein
VSLRPDRLARVATAVSAFVAVLAGTPGTAAAVPPPPNPGDSQLDAAADDANSKAGTVDALAAKLAGAQDQLNQLHQQLHQQLELTLEQANKAMVDLQSAQGAAAAAANAAETDAQRAVRDADTAVLEADKQGTLFAVGSFQQGSTIGNFSAYLASTSPEDLLDRVALLNAVGGSKLDVMSTVAHALQRSVEANTAARATKERADAAAGAADNAKRTADTATRGATQAQQTQYVKRNSWRRNGTGRSTTTTQRARTPPDSRCSGWPSTSGLRSDVPVRRPATRPPPRRRGPRYSPWAAC